jgi:prepilin-type N-terminal cleavage/methylation domain-containing protein
MMNQKGITLIELVVVMAIIAIGAVLIAPNIGAWLPNYRLRSATRDLVSTMRVAQMKAISNNLRYQISFDIGNNSYILQYQNTGGAWVNDGAVQTLPTGVQFNTTFGNIANFFQDSRSTNGNVILNNTKGTTKTIQLLGTTGRIKSG